MQALIDYLIKTRKFQPTYRNHAATEIHYIKFQLRVCFHSMPNAYGAPYYCFHSDIMRHDYFFQSYKITDFSIANFNKQYRKFALLNKQLQA